MIVPNMGGGGAVRHIQRGFSSSATIALSGFKNLDKMFVEVESGTNGSVSSNRTTAFVDGTGYINETSSRSSSLAYFVSNVSGSTTSAHISAFSLTSMTLTTPTPVMYQVIEFS